MNGVRQFYLRTKIEVGMERERPGRERGGGFLEKKIHPFSSSATFQHFRIEASGEELRWVHTKVRCNSWNLLRWPLKCTVTSHFLKGTLCHLIDVSKWKEFSAEEELKIFSYVHIPVPAVTKNGQHLCLSIAQRNGMSWITCDYWYSTPNQMLSKSTTILLHI